MTTLLVAAQVSETFVYKGRFGPYQFPRSNRGQTPPKARYNNPREYI